MQVPYLFRPFNLFPVHLHCDVKSVQSTSYLVCFNLNVFIGFRSMIGSANTYQTLNKKFEVAFEVTFSSSFDIEVKVIVSIHVNHCCMMNFIRLLFLQPYLPCFDSCQEEHLKKIPDLSRLSKRIQRQKAGLQVIFPFSNKYFHLHLIIRICCSVSYISIQSSFSNFP